MFKKLRNIIAVFLILIMGINLPFIDSKAEDASVVIALSSSSVSIGQNVSVTVSVSGSTVSQYTIYLTYDASVLQFVSGSGAAQANGSGGTITLCGGTGSTTLTFTAVGNGNCYVSTSGTEVYDIDYNQLSISHAGANVTVATEEPTTEAPTTEAPSNDEPTTQAPTTEAPSDDETTEEQKSANCNLVSLQVSPGELEPEFSYDVTSYTVNLEEDQTSIIVSAETEDSNASTNVTGADELKPGSNIVKVIVTAENGAVKIYTLNVIVGDEAGVAKATIDGTEYTFITDVLGLSVPEGYSSTTMQYKDWEVLAFESPNKKIVLVCLQDENLKNYWYIYRAETDEFIPYNEYSPNYNRYIIMSVPDDVTVPATFTPEEITINGKKVSAFKSSSITDSDIYVVYAMNIDAEEGFYLYDMAEGTFLRYSGMVEDGNIMYTATASDATMTDVPTEPKEETFFTKQNMLYICIGAGALILLLIVILISVGIKSKKYKNELEDAEVMIEQLVNVTGGKVNHEALDTIGDVKEDKKSKKKQGKSIEEEIIEAKNESDVEEEETVDVNAPIDTIKLQDIDPSDDDTSRIDVQVISEIVDLDKEETERKTQDEAYNEFEKQSAAINSKIKENYDVDKDSAFSDESQH